MNKGLMRFLGPNPKLITWIDPLAITAIVDYIAPKGGGPQPTCGVYTNSLHLTTLGTADENMERMLTCIDFIQRQRAVWLGGELKQARFSDDKLGVAVACEP